MELFFFILFILIAISPLGAAIRAIRFASKSIDYIRPSEPGVRFISGCHDVVVMVILPLTYFATIGDGLGYSRSYYLLPFIIGLIILVVIAYFTGIVRDELTSPLAEAGGILLMGTGISVNLCMLWEFGVDDAVIFLGGIGHFPVIVLCVLMIYRRHRMFQLATKNEVVLTAHHEDILDFIPDRSTRNQYAVSQDGWESVLWLEGWQKLLLSVGVSGGILVILIGALDFFT